MRAEFRLVEPARHRRSLAAPPAALPRPVMTRTQRLPSARAAADEARVSAPCASPGSCRAGRAAPRPCACRASAARHSPGRCPAKRSSASGGSGLGGTGGAVAVGAQRRRLAPAGLVAPAAARARRERLDAAHRALPQRVSGIGISFRRHRPQGSRAGGAAHARPIRCAARYRRCATGR
jgi:hypothetical protein